MTCGHCGADGPEGPFCARCGAHQGSATATTRVHHFAAAPGEHLAFPAIFSTLLPQAGRRHANGFRTLLLAGLALVAVLWATGIIGIAFIVAALLVPMLYLVFLRRAEVYREDPLLILAATFGGGLVTGTVVTAVAQRLISTTNGVTTGALVALAVVVPLAEEVVKPLPALALRNHPRYSETVDGLTLGISAGLGFALAEAAVTFIPVIRSLGLRVDPSNWFVPLTGAALLVPLMQASCTGILTAALWRTARGRAGPVELAGWVIAPVAHMLFAGIAQIATSSHLEQACVLAGEAIVVVLLLLFVRLLLHAALLDEAADLGLERIDCGHCREHVVAAAFCPRCGAAVPPFLRRRAT